MQIQYELPRTTSKRIFESDIWYSRQKKNSWKISPYSSAYKKRMIRQKVEAVMGSVESVWLCLEKGETLRNVVAQSCLFQRKKTFNGINEQELIWHVFSEVANELGVRKAFCELIPEELWNQRVQMMSVPDWMLLLCKLESTISDDSWQMILNRTRLGKGGVSLIASDYFLCCCCCCRFSLSLLEL